MALDVNLLKAFLDIYQMRAEVDRGARDNLRGIEGGYEGREIF